MKITRLDNDILFIGYSGAITLKEGILNMDVMEKRMRELALNKKVIAIILDIRNTVWENQETHNTLSALSRKKFNPSKFNFTIYTAIVNSSFESLAFENEHWFYTETDAIKWLTMKMANFKETA